MSFMRRKAKLTKTDEDVRSEKSEISNAIFAPLRRESEADLKAEKPAIDPREVEILNARHECLSIIDEIITAKLRHRPNKEIKLYDALISECYDFYRHRLDIDNTATIRLGILDIIQNHATNASKASDKKSASMTSFGSDMAVIIKTAIHRHESKQGKGSRKSQRKSLPIAIAQNQAKRMFDLRKSGYNLDESSEEQREGSGSENDSNPSRSSSNNDNNSP